MSKPARRKTNGRTHRIGAAALEFAVILPLLVTLVLGCVDFGRFAHTHVAVINAARAGAGCGGDTPYSASWPTQVQQAVEDEMNQLSGFAAASLIVTATVVNETEGNWRAEVEVGYPFRTIVAWPGFPNHVILRQAAVMRAVNPMKD